MSPRSVAVLLVLTSVPPLRLPAQESGRVIVVDSGAKDLKRTAHRLRIPVAQLKNARAALVEATDLARQVDPILPQHSSTIGRLWLEMHRSAAASNLESLIRALRSRAQETEEGAVYQRATSAAVTLVGSLAQVDSEKAVQAVRSWPAPRDEAKPGTGGRSDPSAQLRTQAVEQIANRDPDRALALFEEFRGADDGGYGLRGRLAAQLFRQGRKEEALKVADAVSADFARRPADARGIQEYQMFVGSLAQIDADRALAAFESLGRAGAAGPAKSTTMRVGDQSLQLTGGEMAQFNALRSFQSRPELALKALKAAPDLKAKVDAAGGLDRTLVSGPSGPGTPYMSFNPGTGEYPPAPGTPGARPGVAPPALISELRGKAAKDPGFVRQVLAQKASDPETLIQVAQRTSYDDPDLASLAIERAAALVAKVEPVDRRARVVQQLVTVSRQVDGEVDPAVFKQGFLVVDELRDSARAREAVQGGAESAAAPGPAPRAGGANQADMLEATLVAEYARVDFDAALKFARGLDEPQRLGSLVQIAQALRTGF